MTRLVFVIAVVLVVLCGIGAYLQEEAWKQYVIVHHCKVTGKIDSHVTTGIGLTSSGQTVVTNNVDPERTIYQCDEGMRVH